MEKSKKMKNFLKMMALGTACILGVCGCGFTLGGDANDIDVINEEPEGADWRTWGIIDDYGTITADGTDTDVCVCLFADRAEFYYNKEHQELYKTIEFPEKLTDEEYVYLSMEIADYTGDGNSDVSFAVGKEDAIKKRFSYIYDQGEFVFDEASAFSAPDEAVDEENEEGVNGKVDFSGRYTEPQTGRGLIEISKESEETYTITVEWANGADSSNIWAITGATYGEYGDELLYTDALCYIRSFVDDETYTDDEIYSDGSGRFYMTEGGMLGWESNNSYVDEIHGETLFERLDELE